jgi:hypothetical protein
MYGQYGLNLRLQLLNWIQTIHKDTDNPRQNRSP